MDREVATTYPDGEVVSRTFNSQGLTNVVSGATSYQSAATHNAAGQPTQLSFGNGRNQHFTYRPDLRLESLTVSPTAPATMYTYGYDLKGNMQTITDSSIPVGVPQTTTFGYDERDRLTSVSGPTTSNFEYDAIGNMTRKEEGVAQGPPENAVECQNPGDDDNDGKINDGCTTSYPSLNYACSPACTPSRPHAVKTAAGSDGAHAFSYDASGNTTRETLNGADLRLYEYDAEGRQARAQLEPGAPFSSYTYDADGQLVKVSGPKRVVTSTASTKRTSIRARSRSTISRKAAGWRCARALPSATWRRTTWARPLS
jgi:YD repeat-containing protein